jgi:surface antigen
MRPGRVGVVMRVPAGPASVLLGVAAAIALALSAGFTAAQDAKSTEVHSGPAKPFSQSSPSGYADIRATLDENDEIATLEAIRVALTEVGDGSTYVWHRRHGRLSGLVRPTTSFRDVSGRICRHILLIMNSGAYTARAEGVACRMPDGRWQLDG